MAKLSRDDFYLCPGCGEEVAVGSPSCPHCDPRKEWEQDSVYDDLDLPEEEFDYDEFVEREFGSGPSKSGKEWFWGGVALAVLLILAWKAIGGL